MTEAENYNGWTNYPTWAVNLWLSNDQGLNDSTLDVVANYYDGAERDENVLPTMDSAGNMRAPIWTLAQCQRFRVTDALKEWIDELRENEQRTGFLPTASIFTDLLGWALSSINWDELAEGWIITLKEQRDYEKSEA